MRATDHKAPRYVVFTTPCYVIRLIPLHTSKKKLPTESLPQLHYKNKLVNAVLRKEKAVHSEKYMNLLCEQNTCMLKGTHLEQDCLLQCFTGQVVSVWKTQPVQNNESHKEAHNYVVRGSNTS